jgi:hypothetical protein
MPTRTAAKHATPRRQSWTKCFDNIIFGFSS